MISNGLQVEESDLGDGRRRTRWVQSVPIASWLHVLGVSPFAVQHLPPWRGVPIQTWVYPQDRDAGFHDFAVPTTGALDFYHSRIGEYAYEKLAHVQSNSVKGGMESASAIFYGDDSVTGRRTERWRNVIIHEIAHQWWGNAVTERDWDDVWLSEGFATYFTLLYIEHAHGRDAFVAGLSKSRDSIRAFDAKTPGYRIVHDTLADMAKVVTRQTYEKGGWTLHMLRGLLGDETFWAGIRAYYARYRNANASTADFRQVIEEVSGRDLGWFFEQWLERPGGFPQVKGTWSYDAQARAIRIELEQAQPEAPYRLPIELSVRTSGSQPPRLERIEMRERRQAFTIAADAQPEAVTLDPGSWTLMDAELVPEAGRR